jgi:hypothetical protein
LKYSFSSFEGRTCFFIERVSFDGANVEGDDGGEPDGDEDEDDEREAARNDERETGGEAGGGDAAEPESSREMVGEEGGETKREENEASDEREDVEGRGSTECRCNSSLSTTACAGDCCSHSGPGTGIFCAAGAAVVVLDDEEEKNMGGLLCGSYPRSMGVEVEVKVGECVGEERPRARRRGMSREGDGGQVVKSWRRENRSSCSSMLGA